MDNKKIYNDIPKSYDAKAVESKIFQMWEDSGYLNPDKMIEEYKEKGEECPRPFVMTLPPPNANDNLHLGHVSGYTYQDLLGRYNRMNGRPTLLLPGKDHAGIQTEVVFEKHLEKKGIRKRELGREEFYKQCYDFCMMNAENARRQEKAIGLSADYSREKFTLDPALTKVIMETFEKMFNEGLVYRGTRIINWCTRCQTALADIDTEHEEKEGTFSYIKYPVVPRNKRIWKLNFYNSEILQAIKDGRKTVETRVLNPEEPERFFGEIERGDLIICVDKNANRQYAYIAKDVRIYKNLEEILKKEDFSKIYIEEKQPNTVEDIVNDYNKLAENYGQKAKQNGMVAIELEAVNWSLFTDSWITVATTRVETMLGDTAVAVDPKDERYKDLVGKMCIVPFVNREIPIIADYRVDMEFGTGAVKVTPAHSPVDYEIGKDHGLEEISVIDRYGKMTEAAGERYAGMKIIECREHLIKDLGEIGLLEKVEPFKHAVTTCERCKRDIEPLIQNQWFVDVQKLKIPAIEAVKEGKTKIYPESKQKVYLQWMENLKDWCISRQLWWGHQIPVWYCGSRDLYDAKLNGTAEGLALSERSESNGCGHAFVQYEGKPERCPKCGGTNLERDPDVFDTWFSSGQWPFSTLGGPEGEDFKKFYPTDVLETGADILFFWVARMMMMGCYRTGNPPFHTVFLHGLVTDKNGQKMSKSKGNGIDPTEMMQKYGTDSLRYTFLFGNAPGQNYRMYEDKIKSFRNFVNKIWNGSRFAMLQFGDLTEAERIEITKKYVALDEKTTPRLEALSNIVKEITRLLDEYRFGIAAESLYEFWWHTFCDQYIEEIKNEIGSFSTLSRGSGHEVTEGVSEKQITLLAELLKLLTTQIKLLHPFTPFVTEEIWQTLRGLKLVDENEPMLMTGKWPK